MEDPHAFDRDPANGEASDIYGEDGAIRSSFLHTIGEILETEDADRLKEEIADLHQSEVGDLLEALQPDQRGHLVRLSGADFDFTALTEVDDTIRAEIVESLPNEQIAQAVQELDSDDAVYILEDLNAEDQEEILAQLPFPERIRLRRSLDYPEETAGRRMQTEFVAVPAFWSVGQTIDYLRDDQNLPERFSQIFVVDPTFKLVGAVDLDQVLRSKRGVRIEEVMHEMRHALPATMDQEEAAREFEQYDLLSAAVVDENERLVGVLTIDDVVDVIQQEAEEDLLRMGGVGDEELSDSVRVTSRLRVPWLLVNLVTAFVAASVISLFEATIEQIVALAVLMPIVAGMGGNAGSQTMTVTVRALATRDLDIYNAGRIIRREMGVGIINGVLFAVLIGAVAGFWFEDTDIGGVIAAAMIINMFAAALAGILIPLLLDRVGADPAVSSSVFVTAVTDIVGFFSFLGIATWWFALS
ncbi:magnesium transporter [Tianweitania sediminis]|uniref:Magnesium transporter MgtE n=1 Tax=Tianweitania sediminis TaxID=1502156 RepID=A0A8J7UII4_9HYPH|nr:magnesium transporter [Tianweitania sediminis]MBP0440284.1 magnesium transporter [Tianweitania sediminis]HEV7415213.1 magnesium transporter [Tianweitania sediminis]